ncbi:MAG: hypothetical protein QM532_01630, partial [Cyanobium sp. MAG06]|nr:hypothetical protein [Cyanobium sp. MAG06]
MKESFNQIIHHYSYKLNEIKKISKVKPVKKETLLPTNNTPASPVNQSLQVKQPTPEKSDKTQSLQLPKMVSLNTINDYRKKIDELPYDKIDEEVLREHYK